MPQAKFMRSPYAIRAKMVHREMSQRDFGARPLFLAAWAEGVEWLSG